MSVLVFGNHKGGVGKSTLSVLYAHWLAERQRQRVAVIDLDSQCNCSTALARFDGGTSAASLFAPGSVHLAPVTGPSITLVRGSKKLADLELARPEVVIPAFRRQLVTLAEGFDAIVIDTPPALGLRTSAALIAATHVVCPIELEAFSIDGVTDMLKTIFGVRQRYNPPLRLAGIVANRFNPHSVRQKAALHALVTNYSDFVLPARISTRSAIPAALAAGLPVWRLANGAAREASAEVLEVFALLHQRMHGAAAPPDLETVGARWKGTHDHA